MMRNQSWPAVTKTGSMMFSAGAMFAAVGGLYSGVSCVSEGIRGKADFWNGVYGGLAAGQVVGIKGRSLGLGVGAGVAFAAASAAADAAGYKVRGEGGFDDGATPQACRASQKVSEAKRISGTAFTAGSRRGKSSGSRGEAWVLELARASLSPPHQLPRTPRGTKSGAKEALTTAPRPRASTFPTRTERGKWERRERNRTVSQKTISVASIYVRFTVLFRVRGFLAHRAVIF